jgi:hypothetical protein
MTGYAFTVPKLDSWDLSEYTESASSTEGVPSSCGGIRFYQAMVIERQLLR